ncbi:MAG: hypothetical protein PHQ42_04530 [Patescibacteria group bacterium]|nr:hypothetical protein [Patescibacteria group bacterium]
MLSNNLGLYAGKILIDLLRDIIYFPLWWYSRGLKQLTVRLKNFLVNKEKSLALFVWIKNIFRPMYSQYDWAGILISFFVRLFQIIFRGIFMLFWLALALFILGLWLALPVLAIYEIIFQLFL